MTFFILRDKKRKNFSKERVVLKENHVLSRETSIKNELGMHARPASTIAQLAESAKAEIWIHVNDQKVDATSIIDILSLCAVKDTKVKVSIEDSADAETLDKIIEFFESAFGET